jgi:Holliday junction resolvase
MEKSSRHSKIIGEFGEHLVCDALSKSNFEVVRVDHTGLDIIAYDKENKKRLGITVKSRTRDGGTVNESINVFSHQSGKDDRKKLLEACEYFGCEPWVAIYSENEDEADLYLVSLETFNKYHGGKAIEQWKVSTKMRKQYIEDPEVKHLNFKLDSNRWRF